MQDTTPAEIREYNQYHTDQTVKFVVKMDSAKLEEAKNSGLHSFFKLSSVIHSSSMVLFDAYGVLRRVICCCFFSSLIQ